MNQYLNQKPTLKRKREEDATNIMHELFLTATIQNDDIVRMVRILQGYCGMKPQQSLYRRLIWEGPRLRAGLKGVDPSIIKRQPPQKIQLWGSLHEQLVRQSYILHVIYELPRESFGKSTEQDVAQMGPDGQPKTSTFALDQQPGTLRWNDIPDPEGKRQVNTRPMLQIENEKNLCFSMQVMQYRFVRQIIQECYRFINGNVIFELSRYLQLPEGKEALSEPLPTFETLTPFDTENKWILTISVRVVNGKDLDLVQQGIGELMTVKNEFDGCCHFHVVPRLTLDTRTKMA
ncbi:hypothetical protein HYALB_00007106 [Hymenoscyphus albidus]|uniref:Mediator of RNA polymerase II transcription subunit 18 n=1 Tax=Hymenoscyphus albidus TaxID=595503 RepID=A0A9N9QCE8_9HELO|nr:hypothetical protein HYALB_00007106 [Hymenoscyphus albidus]